MRPTGQFEVNISDPGLARKSIRCVFKYINCIGTVRRCDVPRLTWSVSKMSIRSKPTHGFCYLDSPVKDKCFNLLPVLFPSIVTFKIGEISLKSCTLPSPHISHIHRPSA